MKAFFKMFFIFDSQMWIPDDTKIHVFKNKPETEVKSNGIHNKHNWQHHVLFKKKQEKEVHSNGIHNKHNWQQHHVFKYQQ